MRFRSLAHPLRVPTEDIVCCTGSAFVLWHEPEVSTRSAKVG
jgi:hypothetical protein